MCLVARMRILGRPRQAPIMKILGKKPLTVNCFCKKVPLYGTCLTCS